MKVESDTKSIKKALKKSPLNESKQYHSKRILPQNSDPPKFKEEYIDKYYPNSKSMLFSNSQTILDNKNSVVVTKKLKDDDVFSSFIEEPKSALLSKDPFKISTIFDKKSKTKLEPYSATIIPEAINTRNLPKEPYSATNIPGSLKSRNLLKDGQNLFNSPTKKRSSLDNNISEINFDLNKGNKMENSIVESYMPEKHKMNNNILIDESPFSNNFISKSGNFFC